MYVIVSAYALAILLLYAAKFFSRASKQFSFAILIVAWGVLSCIVGLRSWKVGIDSNQYAVQFMTFDVHQLTLRDYIAPGYAALQLLLQFIGCTQYQYLFFVMAAISFFFLISAIWKQSEMPSLSLFLLLCFGNMLEAVNQYREFLALCIVFFAMYFLDEGRNKTFYLFVLLAISFHITAVICLLIPLFKRCFHKNFSMVAVVVLSLPIFYLLKPVLRSVMVKVPYLQYYVGSEFDTGTTINSVFAFIFRFTIFIWILYYRNGQEVKTDNLLGALNFGMLIQSLAVSLPMLSRLPFYGIQFISLLVPDRLRKIERRKSAAAYLSLILIILLFLIYFSMVFLQKDYQTGDYTFYWQVSSQPTAILYWKQI